MPWYDSSALNLAATEAIRVTEEVVRQLLCRTCEAPPGHSCTHPAWMRDGQRYAHILRYQDAADGGLVPPIRNGYRVSIPDRP